MRSRFCFPSHFYYVCEVIYGDRESLVSLVLTSPKPFVKMKTLRSCSRGDEDVLYLGALWVRVGAPSGRFGLYPLPRPTARQPFASSGDRTLRRTAVTSESPAARARILARSRTRSRVGSQAAGAYSSRRADDPRTQGSWRRAPGSDS